MPPVFLFDMSDRIIITILAFCLSLLGFTANGAPKGHQVEGCVIEAESKAPVIGAAVRIGTDYLWTTTDIDGRFRFENVQSGEYELEVSCLGYVNYIATIDIRALR